MLEGAFDTPGRRGAFTAGASLCGIAFGCLIGIIIMAVRARSVAFPVWGAIAVSSFAACAFATWNTLRADPDRAGRTLIVTGVAALLVSVVSAVVVASAF